jgi:hypothetical protein
MRVPFIVSWCIATLLVLAPWPGFAACAPKLPFCQSRPSLTDHTVAIFVGKVKSVTMPAVTRAVPPRQPRTSQAEVISGRNETRLPIQSEHELPIDEKRYPVANFDVIENFVGAMSPEFTVHLTSDVFLGSIPHGVPAFSDGEVWLVEAYYDTHLQQWVTSTCQRTKRASAASDDLQALRAWTTGKRLAGRVQGQVAKPTEGRAMSGVRVALRGLSQTLSTTTDNRGHFSFEGLEPGVYEATTDGARAIRVNLTHARCSYAVFILD